MLVETKDRQFFFSSIEKKSLNTCGDKQRFFLCVKAVYFWLLVDRWAMKSQIIFGSMSNTKKFFYCVFHQIDIGINPFFNHASKKIKRKKINQKNQIGANFVFRVQKTLYF